MLTFMFRLLGRKSACKTFAVQQRNSPRLPHFWVQMPQNGVQNWITASSWPLKQGRKKCSKHGCADRGTSTSSKRPQLGRTKRKRYVLTFMFRLLGRKSACKTFAGSNEILRWLTPFLGPNMDPKMGSRIGSHFHSFF